MSEPQTQECPDFPAGTVLRHHADGSHSIVSVEPECVQCGARRKRGEFGKWWPTGAWSCRLCYEADFG